MPYISDKKSIKNPTLDRRVKLLPEQKEEIRKRWLIHTYKSQNKMLGEFLSTRKLAKEYGVSRKTIQFILDEKKHIENLKRRMERGGSKQYYEKKSHAKAMRSHRKYKYNLFKQGLLQ